TTSFVLMCYPFPYYLASGRYPHALILFPFLGRFRFLDTGPAKDIRDHVVAFVTRRLIHGPFGFRPRNFHGPWLLPGGGIFESECVGQYVVRGTRETFDEMQFFAGTSKWRAIGEIRGVDHQRISLPMSYRISSQLPDILRALRT